MRRTPRGGVLVLVFGMVLATAGRLHAATFVVNSADVTGDGTCDAAHCSLIDAITAANALAGADRIEFSLLPSGTTHTLSHTIALPPITDAVEIDGYTQSGAQANTNIEGSLDSVIRIDLAAGAALAEGLRIEAANVTIRGLAVRGYATNISIADTSSGVVIAGNYIGTAADGLTGSTSAYGVRCDLCAGVTIGGSAPEDRNLISGNDTAGIATARPAGSTPLVLTIRGNLIGTNRLAAAAIPNGYGIHLYTPSTAAASADRVNIGGFEQGESNIIAGNTSDAIYVQRTAGFDFPSSRLWIILNLIGTTDYDATTVLGNGGAGVVTAGMVKAMVSSNRVAHNGGKGLVVRGTTTPNGSGVLLRNAIVDNAGLGIDLGDDGRTANDADDRF
jgi:hypothetical protein